MRKPKVYVVGKDVLFEFSDNERSLDWNRNAITIFKFLVGGVPGMVYQKVLKLIELYDKEKYVEGKDSVQEAITKFQSEDD